MLVPVLGTGAKEIERFKNGGQCPPYKFSFIQDISLSVPVLTTGSKEIRYSRLVRIAHPTILFLVRILWWLVSSTQSRKG